MRVTEKQFSVVEVKHKRENRELYLDFSTCDLTSFKPENETNYKDYYFVKKRAFIEKRSQLMKNFCLINSEHWLAFNKTLIFFYKYIFKDRLIGFNNVWMGCLQHLCLRGRIDAVYYLPDLKNDF